MGVGEHSPVTGNMRLQDMHTKLILSPQNLVFRTRVLAEPFLSPQHHSRYHDWGVMFHQPHFTDFPGKSHITLSTLWCDISNTNERVEKAMHEPEFFCIILNFTIHCCHYLDSDWLQALSAGTTCIFNMTVILIQIIAFMHIEVMSHCRQ